MMKLPINPVEALANIYAYSMVQPTGNAIIDFEIEYEKREYYNAFKEWLLDCLYFGLASEFRHAYLMCSDEESVPYKKDRQSHLANTVLDNHRIFDGGYEAVSYKYIRKTELQELFNDSLYRRHLGMFHHRGTKVTSQGYYITNDIKRGISVYRLERDLLKWGLERHDIVDYLPDVFNLSWARNYGGKGWADAASGWLKLHDATEPNDMLAYIDHIIDIQHNTGFILNKSLMIATPQELKALRDDRLFDSTWTRDSCFVVDKTHRSFIKWKKRTIKDDVALHFNAEFHFEDMNCYIKDFESFIEMKAMSTSVYNVLEFASSDVRDRVYRNMFSTRRWTREQHPQNSMFKPLRTLQARDALASLQTG